MQQGTLKNNYNFYWTYIFIIYLHKHLFQRQSAGPRDNSLYTWPCERMSQGVPGPLAC